MNNLKWEELGWQDRSIRVLQAILIPITIAVVGWYVSITNESGKIEAEKIKAATVYVEPFYGAIQSLRQSRRDMQNWALKNKHKFDMNKMQRAYDFASASKNTRFRYEELVILCNYINDCKVMDDFIIHREHAKTRVRALSGYGETAIPFLISILEDEDVEIRKLATVGFELISNTKGGKHAVGVALSNILSNETRLYSWFTHESAILILGWIDYKDAKSEIENFSKKLNQKYWQKAFDNKDSYTKEGEDRLKRSIVDTLELLKG